MKEVSEEMWRRQKNQDEKVKMIERWHQSGGRLIFIDKSLQHKPQGSSAEAKDFQSEAKDMRPDAKTKDLVSKDKAETKDSICCPPGISSLSS